MKRLDLQKELKLTLKQFKTKLSYLDIEFKEEFYNSEVDKIKEFINLGLNRAELREIPYIKDGWISCRVMFKEISEKYNVCNNTIKSVLSYLSIKTFNPIHQLSFLSEEDYKKLINFLKIHSDNLERRLFMQKETIKNKYNVDISNPSQLEESRDKISKNVKKSCTKERQEKIEETKLKKYGKRSVTNSKKGILSKLKKYGKINISYKYLYDDIYFDSSWELCFYIYHKEILKDDITRGNIFEYFCNGKTHFYSCDFLVNGKNIEIKGNHLIKDGILKQMKNEELNLAKTECMIKNNVIVLTYNDIKPIIKIITDNGYNIKDYNVA